MKGLTLFFLLVLTLQSSFGQNIPVFSEQKGELILLGEGGRSGLEVPPFDEWFFPEYDAYVPKSNIEVYFVDGDKTCPGLDGDKYKIELVPRFILFRNGEELGRIVETPNESLESDMYHIVK